MTKIFKTDAPDKVEYEFRMEDLIAALMILIVVFSVAYERGYL